MGNGRNKHILPESQVNLVHLIVKNTLKKHDVKPNVNLSPEEKRKLLGVFQQLQEEVNDFLQMDGNQSTPAERKTIKKKGKRHR